MKKNILYFNLPKTNIEFSIEIGKIKLRKYSSKYLREYPFGTDENLITVQDKNNSKTVESNEFQKLEIVTHKQTESA